MKSFVVALLCLLFVSHTAAFQPRSLPAVRSTSATSLNVFGNKKTTAPSEEESQFWQGEWVCADCGYIYNRVSIRNGS